MTWSLTGSYAETCSCELMCPCNLSFDHGAWCIGCCWALMASLFALGVMSIAWMAFVAALIAAEKLLPWRRVATYGTAGILLALGLLLLVAPGVVPGLAIPGDEPAMPMPMSA